MKTLLFPGGWYADALPSGEYAVIRHDNEVVETHIGTLVPPDRCLFPRVDVSTGAFKIAGQAHGSNKALEYIHGRGWQTLLYTACGVSPVIYRDGILLVSDCGPGLGSQGYRYVAADGTVVTGDATYGPQDGIDLYEWTDLGNGWRFGQGPDDGDAAGGWAHRAGRYYRLVSGAARFLRVRADGDRFSLACWVENAPSIILTGTFAEIEALEWVASPRASRPTPTPAPQPEPTPVIPHSEILSAVTTAKAEVEALGHRFKTREEVESIGFHDEDRKRALLVTLRATWKLAQQYPSAGIGLEAYEGFSGVQSPFVEDGAQKYSFDIILLSRQGPSVDILGAGVTPTVQVDDTTDPEAPRHWARDWRPPLNPYRGVPVPTHTPQPTPPPQPVPPVFDVAVVLAKIDELGETIKALHDEVSEYRLHMAEMEVSIRNEVRASGHIDMVTQIDTLRQDNEMILKAIVDTGREAAGRSYSGHIDMGFAGKRAITLEPKP